MSWNNIIPWQVLIMKVNYESALICGAFSKDFHVSDMRDDYFY